jgi:hypothetical protein
MPVKLHCSGCGTTDSIEEIRARHPEALSCCPERRMVLTCLCGKDFVPKRNSKTCSSKCSATNKKRRERVYNAAHPLQRRASSRKWRADYASKRRFTRLVNRAVKVLFQEDIYVD